MGKVAHFAYRFTIINSLILTIPNKSQSLQRNLETNCKKQHFGCPEALSMGCSIKWDKCLTDKHPQVAPSVGLSAWLLLNQGLELATTPHTESPPKSLQWHSNQALQTAKPFICPIHQPPHKGGWWNPLILPNDLPSLSCLLQPGSSLLQKTRVFHPKYASLAQGSSWANYFEKQQT